MATTAPATDNKIVIYDVSWETYERLLSDLSDRSSPRLTYDRGRLEIMSPTTFRRQDLERGFEPDSCFYVQSLSKLESNRRVDLGSDPPPDLVIEIKANAETLRVATVHPSVGVGSTGVNASP